MNVLTRFTAMKLYLAGKSIFDLFPYEWIENLHYTSLRECCCLRCGRHMGYGEMHPKNRLTPRAICPECWSLMTAGLTNTCWVCGDNLENSRFANQQKYAQDLHYRIHSGRCCDLFSLASTKVLGQETGILEDNDNSFSPVYPERVLRFSQTFISRTRYLNNKSGSFQQIPAPKLTMLPPSTEKLEVPRFSGFDKVRELIPRRHNGKKVIHISK